MIPGRGSGGFTAPEVVRRAACLAAALALVQAVVPARAQSPGGVSLSASAGFDGYFSEGHWIPVRVGLANDGPEAEVLLEVLLQPSPSGRVREHSQTISLAAGARKIVSVYVFPAGGTRSVRVRLLAQDRLISQTDFPLISLSGTDMLIGVMAADPTPFNRMRDPTGSTMARRLEIAWLTAESLPDQGSALAGLDGMIIDDQDTGTLTASQRQALAAWVASGGRLLVCGGPSWQKTTAGLAGLLPLEVTGTQQVPSLDSVGTQLGAGAGPAGLGVLAVGRPTADAEVVIEQGGLPVALTRRYGRGQITFLAADPALAPLDNWPAIQVLYRALLIEGPYAPAVPWALQEDSAASAASLFPNLTFPPIGAVCGFLALYTFALGPLHYLLLRRAKRRELAWITIPALVVVFSGVAFGVGSLSRGSRPVLNRMAIVHVPAGAERAQVKGVLGVFAPNRRALSIEFPAGLLVRPLSGGYSLADGAWEFHQTPGGSGEVEIQLDAASVRGVAFEGDIASPGLSHSLATEQSGDLLLVEGQVVSQDLRLKDSALITPYGAIVLGDLEPGEPHPVRESFSLTAFTGEAYWEMVSAVGAIQSAYSYGPTGFEEIQLLRRGSLLGAIQPGVEEFVGSGTYLVGWSDAAPLPVEATGARSADDLTLYLFELGTALGPATQAQIMLPEAILAPTLTPAVPQP